MCTEHIISNKIFQTMELTKSRDCEIANQGKEQEQ